jgi:starch phosphorylase
VRMLGLVPQERYDEVLQDESFLASMDRVHREFRAYMDAETWFGRNHPGAKGQIAYFSCEYGLDEGLPVYSGGLGVLSGDHLKSASDLGLPLTGVGILYREGYFRQYLNADGYQQEAYPENDWYTMPVHLVHGEDGAPVTVEVEFPEETLTAQVWRVQVGRVSLLLLDANIPANSPELRSVTDQLYGGDREMRIRQEMLLAVGGLRALRAVGIEPAVCHINEGHSAFLALERIAHTMETEGVGYAEAIELVRASNVFTTHTPVPAGNERFDPDLAHRYLEPIIRRLGLSWDQVLALGRENPADQNEAFCMTVLALKLSAHCNGVAKLHGKVSRQMWKEIWPGVPTDEVPIGHVTNGIHTRGWLSHDIHALFDRYLGPAFREKPTDLEVFERVESIPDSELWRTHERRRERLVSFVRRRFIERSRQRGAAQRELAMAEEVLDPEALTIGFARRFATYKRGTLLFHDADRLDRILNNPDRPVQLLFAGKSHPHDEPGKALIRELVHRSREDRFRGKIVFIEDYDMAVARYLTQGVDVWLNTPRRPLEASGTSGMKAAVNGALNCSILDGWWDEGYSPEVGWAIGNREEYDDPGLQDWIESQALYELLETEIAPLFYTRGRDGLPRGWIRKMKDSMRILGAAFNTSRMLLDYSQSMYLPAMQKHADLGADGLARASALAKWRNKIDREWPLVAVKSVESPEDDLQVGDRLIVTAQVQLGALTTEDVKVELYYGQVDSQGNFEEAHIEPMAPGEAADGVTPYSGHIPCERSGRFGMAVRILPHHPDLCHSMLPGLIHWAE